MYKLIITELANKDLDNIIFYISIQLTNPYAASSFLDQVEKCYINLRSNPRMFEKCNDIRLEKEGYRKAPIKNYILVYKIDEALKTVYILRFFFGAQDYTKLI